MRKLFLCLVLVLTLISFDTIICAEKDLYKILEVSRSANAAELKLKYRKLTMKYHPDRNGGTQEAKDKFSDVAQAYEILNDPKKRRHYDRGGIEAVQKHEQQAQQGGGHDPFGGMFGHQGHPQEQSDVDLRIKIRVSLLDLYVGKEISVKI